jgi:hypothetical protein
MLRFWVSAAPTVGMRTTTACGVGSWRHGGKCSQIALRLVMVSTPRRTWADTGWLSTASVKAALRWSWRRGWVPRASTGLRFSRRYPASAGSAASIVPDGERATLHRLLLARAPTWSLTSAPSFITPASRLPTYWWGTRLGAWTRGCTPIGIPRRWRGWCWSTARTRSSSPA